MSEIKIEYLPVGQVKPYDKNAKEHPREQIEQIKESIQLFGMDDPIGIWSEDNIIVEGHGRLIACKELGIKEVPVIRLDHLSDEERRAYTLVHNKTTMNSDFDFDILEGELDNILDINMEDFGFEFEYDEPEVVDDEYEPEVPEEPKSQIGQIYKLGEHRLMCGDSTNLEHVEKLCGGNAVDLLLTDPPYNVNYGNVRDVSEAVKLHRRTDGLIIQNDNMDDSQFRQFLVDAFTNANAVMKAGAVFYIWHADNESYNFRGACRDIGWIIRECLIWNKNTFCMGRQDYQWKHEPCLYGWKEGASHLWASD